MQLSKAGRWALLVVVTVALAPLALDAGVQRTEVTILDDWPADSLIDMGTISCPGGEIEWVNPVTPVCPGSGRIHLRQIVGYGCYSALTGGSLGTQLSGVGLFVINGNLDADYSGRVWGTWMIVPSDDCDPADLIDPPSYWEGTWRGRRSAFCAGDCLWIGNLKLVGKGRGGDIDGHHFKGTEVITTFTPLPVPWELIPGFPLTGPEGVVAATIKD